MRGRKDPERLKALAAGQVKYLRAEPCPKGHGHVFYVRKHMCVVCTRLSSEAAYRKNPRRRTNTPMAEWSEDKRLVHSLVGLRHRARKAGLPATVTAADLKAAWPADNRCPILGIELRRNVGGRKASDHSPSIDRLNPALGYVPGNIAVISARANKIKQDAISAEVKAVAAWMEQQGL